ncbi:MAG: TPR end-of-group domain-containing protein [Acidobacteriota bacterium]
MKRCPHCNRVESDQALKFCRVDGATLVSDSSPLDEAGTAQLGADASEVHTSIFPHRTDADMSRATGPTTTLPVQTPTSTGMLGKPKSKKTIVIALVAFALLVAVTAVIINSYVSRQSSAAIDSIAVLPFENKSNDSEAEYLSDGLAESLIYRLSQLPNLKVSPTSSVTRYKGKQTDVKAIASELGVSAVMTGRILKRGDTLMISLELVDVRNNKLLWGEQYERKLSELLATQREIAATITQKLQLKLSGGERGLTKKYTDSNEAYQLYLKGRFHLAKRTKGDILRSIELFREAIKLDPNFALAYVGVADSFAVMPGYPYMSPAEAMPQAKAAVTKALELDPELPEAHTVAGNIASSYDWNWAEAERSFKRALELDPNLAIAHYRYGLNYLSLMGRHDEAIAEMKRVMELEPLSLIQGANYAGVLMYARQFDAALEQARKTYELDTSHVGVRIWMCHTLNAKGMYAESLSISEKSMQGDFPISGPAGYAYAKSGQRQKADAVIARLKEVEKTRYVMNYWIAIIYAALGDKDAAFAELEKAYQRRDWFLQRLKIDPFMDSLRDDPRFKDLLKRMNLPQ